MQDYTITCTEIHRVFSVRGKTVAIASFRETWTTTKTDHEQVGMTDPVDAVVDDEGNEASPAIPGQPIMENVEVDVPHERITRTTVDLDGSGKYAIAAKARLATDGLDVDADIFGSRVVRRELVNAERDRRIAAGFEFGGKTYQFDEASKQRVTGAATLAGFAVAAGAQAGDYRWANAGTDFAFIANDNVPTLMDAQTCFAFGQAAAAHETAHIFAAKAIKDLDPIPVDYTDDHYWP